VRYKYEIRVPLQGGDQAYVICTAFHPLTVAEVIKDLLNCGPGAPPRIEIVVVPAEGN